jgi:transposase
MPKPYSLDLRERLVSSVEAGHSRRAAAAHFRVSPSFVINLMTANGDAGRSLTRRSDEACRPRSPPNGGSRPPGPANARAAAA